MIKSDLIKFLKQEAEKFSQMFIDDYVIIKGQ